MRAQLLAMQNQSRYRRVDILARSQRGRRMFKGRGNRACAFGMTLLNHAALFRHIHRFQRAGRRAALGHAGNILGIGRYQRQLVAANHRCRHFRRHRRAFRSDIAAFAQRIDNRLRILLRLIGIDVAHAAQLQRHRQQAARHRILVAKALRQRQPGFTAGFVERLAAGNLRQQLRFAAQPARQRLNIWPGVRRGVEVSQGFPVAVQINHQICLACHTHQRKALRFQFGFGNHITVMAIDSVADQPFIVAFVRRQRSRQLCRQLLAQRWKTTVEVLARLAVKTSQMGAVPVLAQRQRIGHRHQRKAGAQPASGLQRHQLLLQKPGDRHAGDLVAVQRGLNIDLFIFFFAEVEADDFALSAQRGAEKGMMLLMHRALIVLSFRRGRNCAQEMKKSIVPNQSGRPLGSPQTTAEWKYRSRNSASESCRRCRFF